MNNTLLIDALFANLKTQKLIRNIFIIIIGSLLLTISARVKIDIPPVPITMQTLVVLVFALTVGWKLSVATFSFYLFQGFVGIPVFASSPFGGPAYFIGPTAGYLMGMLLSSYFVGFMAEKNYDKNYFKTLLILFLGSVIIFIPGLLWLGFWYNTLWADAATVDIYQSYSKAINNGLLLYKFTEPVKIALAATITPLIWQFIKNK